MREALGANYDTWMDQYQRELRAFGEEAARTAPAGPEGLGGPRVIVPIVVHIIHTNGGDNISDDQVYDAIRITNEVFQQRDPDTIQVIPYFVPRIGNANIEFRLARLDPQGNCTTGITRHVSGLTNSAGENVKSLPGARWAPQRYLNVWVVENIASGAAGYSYLPCGVGPSQEGIVILNDYFGSIGRAPNSQYNKKSFAHEVGHYLGLPHTWGRTNEPGVAANCQDDDGVSDTPNTIGYSFVCNTMALSCPGSLDPISNVQNIMDYAGCPAMFTTGQATLMNAGIRTNFSCRAQLSSLASLQLAGVADGQNVGPCAPIAYLTATGANREAATQLLCAGESMGFQGEAYNIAPGTPVQFQWRFPGGLPTTSTVANPTITYPTPGVYDVTLVASNAAGTDSTIATGYIRVQDVTRGLSTPDVETFDNPQFALSTDTTTTRWQATPSAGNGRWQYTSSAAAQGTGSAVLPLRNTVSGQEYDLVSPNIVLSTTLARPYVYFKRAYARANPTSDDRLTISYSLTCGQSWITRGGASIRSAAQLETAPPVGGLYAPISSHWRQDSVLLSTGTLAAGAHLMLRFRATSDRGSAMYIDDIRIGGRITGLGAEAAAAGFVLTMYPNPATAGEAQVRVTTGPASGATLRVYDATGRLMGRPITVAAATADRAVALQTATGALAPGVYVVELTTAAGARLTQRALIY